MAEAAYAGARPAHAPMGFVRVLAALCLAVFGFLLAAPGTAEAQTYRYDSVVIEGTQRIEP
ncbi:MAG: hypothetical protein OEM24_05545, partial [Paracoccaceae bacterium]|nr:hypothetical protein [Paracoccaceae bacterium]